MSEASSSPRAARATAWTCAALLALGIALLPLANFEALYTARVSQALAAQIGLLCLGALLLPALLLARRGHHELSRTDLAVLVFGAATLLSTLFGPAPAAFFRESLYAAAFLVVYFLVRWMRPSRGQLIVLGCGTAVAVLLVSVAGILQNRGIETLDYALKERRGKGQIVSLLGNPNYVASFLAPALFLLAGFAIAARHWVWRVVFAMALLPLGWCLALAGGRAAWLGMLAGVFVVAVLLLMVRTGGRLKPWHWLAVGAAPIAAALLLLLALRIAAPNFDLADRLTSYRELHLRLFPWMIGRGMFLDHPLLGIGYGRFFAAYDPYVIDFFQASTRHRLYEYVLKLAPGERPDHLHNEYFQVLVETGLVGLAAFMAVLANATSGAFARLRDGATERTERAAIALFLGAAACTAVDAFWGFPLRLPCSGLLFWLVLALLENNAAPSRA
ncbi:MAG: O-antigen ligase family protein, partial [Phycisphaerales bacterium]|nr:O-antigen ligase family protein [Phycisphaerales bacterium]